MVVFNASLALLLVVGPAAVACVLWARRLRPSFDTADLVSVAYGGLGVAAIAVWIGASLFGLRAGTGVLAAVAGGFVVGAAALLAGTRTGSGDSRAPGRDERDARATSRRSLALKLAAMAVVFVLLVSIPFAPFGLERDERVHRLAMTDWYKHLVVGTALVNSDVFPPPNPFLHTAEDAPYYYGFHLVAAAMARATGADVLAALLLLTLVTAAAVPFVAFSFARRLCDDRRALWAAGAATFLAGFDLVPAAVDSLRNLVTSWPPGTGFAALRAVVPSHHVDYWVHHNERQLNSLYVTTSWAPQHTAGVLLALLAIWLVAGPLWRRDGGGAGERSDAIPASDATGAPARPRAPVGELVVPALLIAALPAVSTYVAIAAGVAVGAILAVELWRRRDGAVELAARWGVAGIGGGLVALPVVRLLASADAPGLTMRISSAGGWKNGAVFTALFGDHQWTHLLDTPAFLLFELGIVGLLAGFELLRRRRGEGLAPAERQALVAVLAVIALTTFVRPPEGPNNLFARPMVLVFVLLTPFAAMAAGRLGRSTAVRAGVVACALATGWAFAGLLIEPIFWSAPVDQVEGMRWANANTPRGTLIAVAPADYDATFGYWLRRPLLIADERHALLFGATPEEFARTAARTATAFGATTPSRAAAGFKELGADAVFVRRDGSADSVSWAGSGCFEPGYRGETWVVLRVLPGGC